MKIHISFLFCILCLIFSPVFAQTIDNQLIDSDNADVAKSIQFKQFSSCKDIDKVLDGYADLFKSNRGNYYGER